MKRYFISFLLGSVVFYACKKEETPVLNTSVESDFFYPANLKVLIVGVLELEDSYDLSSFSTYHRKDKELENTLLQRGVSPENIIALYDSQATLANIYAAFDSIAKQSEANTHFLYYFAGHGFTGHVGDDKQNVYFANYDIEYWYPATTGFNVNYLSNTFLPEFKGSQVLFMADCCQSGSLLAEAQKFSNKGLKAAAITSSAASNWSTGNWTFTQKILDALNGDKFINANGDNKITFQELITDESNAMKYNERQKYASAFFNWDVNETVSTGTQVMPLITNTNFYSGQYVFVKKNRNYYPVQITGQNNNKITCRFYNYSDYESWDVDSDSIKIPYFVNYNVGETVSIESFKPKTATIKDSDNDFYNVVDTDGTGTLWLTYERLFTGNEPDVLIQDSYGNWINGKILDSTQTSYFVTYTGKNYQWDEWVDASRIQF